MNKVEQLTLGELAEVERISGVSVGALGDDNTPKGKAMAALVYVVKKRENPKFTLEDAYNVPMNEANKILGLDEDEVPNPKETV